MELANHEGKWSTKTSTEILVNSPVCTACKGEGISSPGSTCKTCHGTGRILSDSMLKLYSKLCEKEYCEEEAKREAEPKTDYSNEDLHMWA